LAYAAQEKEDQQKTGTCQDRREKWGVVRGKIKRTGLLGRGTIKIVERQTMRAEALFVG